MWRLIGEASMPLAKSPLTQTVYSGSPKNSLPRRLVWPYLQTRKI